MRWAFLKLPNFCQIKFPFFFKVIYHYITPPSIHSRFFKVALWSSAIEGLSSHTVFDGGFLDLIFYNQLEFVNPSPFPFLYGSDLWLLHGSSCCTLHLWAEPLWKWCLESKGKAKRCAAERRVWIIRDQLGYEANWIQRLHLFQHLFREMSEALYTAGIFFRLVISLSVQIIWFWEGSYSSMLDHKIIYTQIIGLSHFW